MSEPTIRDLAIEADSHLSLIVHRYPGGLPDDLLAEMKDTYHGLRDWYESAESHRLGEPKWYIERENGERIDGPFTTRDDALRARLWVERVMSPETFWIRPEADDE